MKVLSVEATIDIYMKRDILIPRGARSCSVHLTENFYVKDDQVDQIPIVSDSIELKNEKVKEILDGFKTRENQKSSLFN
ncbi:unnamed protein product [Brachionus calyciflorus]|uniref:Uncharacterized protein n=1 Tax=Brachionus calyciflorus TaxID=104777 RepID=A0A813ZNA0_9BILA|nr:unnamed protein product [Brachionus calyciflorus]